MYVCSHNNIGTSNNILYHRIVLFIQIDITLNHVFGDLRCYFIFRCILIKMNLIIAEKKSKHNIQSNPLGTKIFIFMVVSIIRFNEHFKKVYKESL